VKGAWLTFLGRRRPTSLADQADYAEVKHENRPEPKSSPMVEGVSGHSVGAGRHRKAAPRKDNR
jgi:hypothetical protein